MPSDSAHREVEKVNGFDQEIDLRELILSVWRRKWTVAAAAFAGCIISIAYAFYVPEVFESTVLLIPTETQKPDQLGAAAALIGGKKAPGTGDLDLYQSLLTSRTVMKKLLRTKIPNWSDTGKGRLEPLLTIFKADTLNRIQYSFLLEGLSRSIFVQSPGTGSGGILQVSVDASTGWLAQEIADTLIALGQDEITRVRAERMDAILPVLEVSAKAAKADWDQIISAIARYRDRNRSILLPNQQLELDRMMMERQLQEQKYLLARKEVEQQILERRKAVPPAVVLDSADLPPIRKKPRRSVIVLIGTALGGMLAVGWILSQGFFKPAVH